MIEKKGPKGDYCDNCTAYHVGERCPCPTCHQKGHNYLNCPKASDPESSSSRSTKNSKTRLKSKLPAGMIAYCSKCNQVGHSVEECTLTLWEDNKPEWEIYESGKHKIRSGRENSASPQQ